jgi:hypothetical protein
MDAYERPCHHVIAFRDGGTYYLSGAKIMTVHPEHIRSLASMPSRYTVHPEHKNLLQRTVKGFLLT